MGEVYKARDSRLDRVVALKVISPLLAQTPELRQRFEREARTISQLTHPNICALYDVGEARPDNSQKDADPVRYLVLEYCQGQTLAEKLQKGPLSVEQAVRIAIDICNALQRAHSAGIIHRDLKPANVMLTPTGAKLLDFGLARPTAALVPDTTAASTIQSPLTDRGMILGTFQYMSPEQVEGEEADSRSDIWALGCVIYEMIAGQRAFGGKSQSSVIAAILEREPQPLIASHPEVPILLDALVRACLAKTPEDRIQSAHDVGLQLRWITGDSVSSQARVTIAPKRRRSWIPAAVAAAVALVALAIPAYLYFTAPPPVLPRAIVLTIPAPDGQVFAPVDGFSLSRDGTAIAFTTTAESGERSLWVRRFDSATPIRIASVRNPLLPFWSPDSGSLGVFAGGFLQIVNLAAGTARPLLPAPPASATWSGDGLIVYSVEGSGLHAVGADGSGARQLTKVAGSDEAHTNPLFIPGSNHLTFTAMKPQGKGRMNMEIRTASLASGEIAPTTLTGRVVGFGDGLLMYTTPDGALRAQPWNVQTMTPEGSDRPLRQTDLNAPTSDVRFAVSPSDVLAYRGGTNRNRQQLTWFDKTGTKTGALGETNSYSNPAISPDGRRIAVGVKSAQSEARDVWVFDVARNTPTRLTHDPADDFAPAWSPDGTRVAFTSDRLGMRDIFVTPASGLGPEELVLKSNAPKSVETWSGPYLLFSTFRNNQPDIDALTLPDKSIIKVLDGPYAEAGAALSPEGTLLAYMSDENGTNEVFLRSFPDTSRKWQISKAGGAEPQWRRDGRELYYVSQDDLMAVTLTKGPNGLEPQEPRRLFRQRLGPFLRNRYVASPDGERFLLNVPTTDRTVEPITVILNWQRLPQ
jgi:Tol biopolymer transport system component